MPTRVSTWTTKRTVTIFFADGPLEDTTHSWRTDIRPTRRLVTEWGTYVHHGKDDQGRYVYCWEPVA